MEAAEGAKTGYRRISDRAAAIYAPAVHLLALGTFVGWGVLGGDWYAATTNAIAVLIITCPCALALAVPIAHVVAAGRLFSRGIMMRDGAAIERLAQIRRIAFDKTGTLTEGQPAYVRQVFGRAEHLRFAVRLAMASAHPFSRALAATDTSQTPFAKAREVPGRGVEAREGKDVWRLGRASFCNAEGVAAASRGSTVWLSRNGVAIAGFAFEDPLRPEAAKVMSELARKGLRITMLTGDRTLVARAIGARLGVEDVRADLVPEDKIKALVEFREQGELTLMVGDGLNDAPALRAAHVSMAPASAADVGRMAADFVYTRNSLTSVPFAIAIARRAAAIVRQNFGLAIAYNFVAVPLAVSGQVTPLIAALAMSSSSILVTLNALRLRLGDHDKPEIAARPVEQPQVRVPAE
jgi:Cu2+-exporting ATPase